MAITTLPTDPDAGRFVLRAYVCGSGDVRLVGDDGGLTMTFQQIYVTRPSDCRYAIAGWWAIDRYAYRYATFDLFDVTIDVNTNDVRMPKPRLKHDDFDAIVMATVLLYGGS